MKQFTSTEYHNILSKDFPDFLQKYIDLPIFQRLKGSGLLCGTDFTPLFNNRFYYSRYDHSIGVALIVWNFTKDKKQTIAGLFHDISTPAFSHVNDFRKGDALNQEATEDLTYEILSNDKELLSLLKNDNITLDEISDYKIYPIADNKIPSLSSDRLEYMYPSGASLAEIWNIEEVEENYSHILVLKNEMGVDELGFDSVESAALYTKKFLEISLILQHNEDKIAMQMMADILQSAMDLNLITEENLYQLSESEICSKFDEYCKKNKNQFTRLYKTFRNMKQIVRSEVPVENAYNLSLDVKKRYINPLVKLSDNSVKRISEVCEVTKKHIDDYLLFNDSKFGAVIYEQDF